MHPQPYHQQQAVVIVRNTPATASMVLGIIALAVCWIPLFGAVAWVLAPISLVCAAVSRHMPEVGKGARLAGIITSVIALVVCLCYVAAIFMPLIFGAIEVSNSH